MSILGQLWSDQRGGVISSELVLVTSLTVVGVLGGLKSFRDTVVGELSDMAGAVHTVNNAYLTEAVSSIPESRYSTNSGSASIWNGGSNGDLAEGCVTLFDPNDPTASE